MEIDFEKYPLPKRMRHHTAPSLYLPANELKVLTGGYPPLIEEIDWAKVFLNCKRPDMIDIGCGKGKMLFDIAEKLPDKNILGIEVRRQACEWISTVIKGEDIQNAGILWYSVVNGLGFIEESSIDKIFYLFPDPWTKRKHLKRRAFNSDSIKEIFARLKTGGSLYLATDVAEVNEDHLKLLDEFGSFNYRLVEDDLEWGLPITNKERFCRENKIPIFRIIADRK